MSTLEGDKIRRMMGGGYHEGRDPLDFHPTPLECLVALMRFLRAREPDALRLGREFGILEPCCGDGALGRPLEAMGFRVAASDLVNRGYGLAGVDFLTIPQPRERLIITNPPYTLGVPEAFITHVAHMPRVSLLALLLPAAWWYAGGRRALWNFWRPSWLLPLTWRPDFTGDGNSPWRLQWVVWSRHSHSNGQGRTELLEKPELAPGGALW